MIYIIILIVILIISISVITKKKSSKSSNTIIPTLLDANEETYAVKLMKENEDCYLKKAFLTDRERAFHKELIKEIGDDYYIMAQVRVVDLINPNKKYKKTSKEFKSLFRQISQWHCDFVIIQKETFEIVYAIELDDSTHKRTDRIKRDEILNLAMKQAGVTLLTVNNISDYKNAIISK